MDEDAKKDAQEIFNKLPQDIKEVIFADDYQTILSNIAKEYNLTQEQLGKLEFQTTMVLMGLDKRGYFPFNLESELNLDEDTAQKMSTEISDTVFAEVWRSLDELDQQDVGDEETLNKKLDYEEEKIEEENPSEIETATTTTPVPSPITYSPLTTLTDRLKQASIATPSKREYVGGQKASPDSPVITEPAPTNESLVSKPTIDPYHESIGE